jgi:hypothetical protein
VGPVLPVGPCWVIGAGVDQTIVVGVLEFTKAIDHQIVVVGELGGAFNHPVGGVPVFVE